MVSHSERPPIAAARKRSANRVIRSRNFSSYRVHCARIVTPIDFRALNVRATCREDHFKEVSLLLLTQRDNGPELPYEGSFEINEDLDNRERELEIKIRN